MKKRPERLARIDTIFGHETPEGVELRFELAGPAVRSLAWFTDLCIRATLYIVLALVCMRLGGVGKGLFMVLFFAIEWLYPALFEGLSGTTPGKKHLGLEVVRENGAPLDWTGALLRNLLRAADFLPFFNALGLAVMLCHPRMQRLGDIAAGTLVVYRRVRQNRENLPRARAIAPSCLLSLPEQRLVLDFCVRKNELPVERAKELAALVPGVTGRDGQGDPEARLLAIGNWLLHGSKREEECVEESEPF